MVTCCVCMRIPLAQVVEWAREHATHDAAVVCDALGCSRQCGMCEPFIAYAIATGETAVPWPCPPLPATAS